MRKRYSLSLVVLFLFFINVSTAFAYSNYDGSTVSCGSKLITKIPASIPKVVSIVYIALQIVVPILLVIFGTMDLIKAITAGKEDEIKKAQSTFIRRLVMGVLVFFVFAVVKVIISVAADKGKSARIVDCTNCFLSNNCTGGKKNAKKN